jgi:hypothetical protein
MININKHGLSRYIPKPIERKVRQNSYFGCVICGAGITTIDHVNPEFNDCKEHYPEKMALLCGSCHIKKTKGIIGVQMVEKAKQNPFCKTKNPPSDFLDFGTTEPKIQFGNSLFINPKSLITINGESILSIREPDKREDSDRFLLNAIFHNFKGEESFRIDNNVWYAEIDNWDIHATSKTITIRSEKGNILLKIENIPEDKFIVHRLNMVYKGYFIQADYDGVEIITPSGETMILLDKGHTMKGDIVLNIQNDATIMNNLEMGDLKIREGSNIFITNGTGGSIIL